MKIEESYRRQIAKELKINQSAQCPYIVVCYQSFYDNGSIYIIFEYMDGGSLADFLKKVKKIEEPYLAAICKQVGAKKSSLDIGNLFFYFIYFSTKGDNCRLPFNPFPLFFRCWRGWCTFTMKDTSSIGTWSLLIY